MTGLVQYVRWVVMGCCLLLWAHNSISAQGQFSVDELLQQVERGGLQDQRQNRDRIAQFKTNRAEQQRLLAAVMQQESQLNEQSEQREKAFEDNEQKLSEMQARLTERLGNLKELFGVLQQVATDANGQFENSITQLHYPERSEFMLDFAQKMGQTSVLPSITEIEQLWFELHREMTVTGKVERFEYPVLLADGKEKSLPVTRIGAFNLVTERSYLQWIPETGRVLEYARQPAGQYIARLARFYQQPETDFATVAVDPTRGQLLSLLVKAPSLTERVQQGGVIGYIIIALGIVSVLIALGRLLALTVVKRKIEHQIKTPDAPGRNPLGRILSVYSEHREVDVDTLELKLGEAVLRELPKINRGLSLLKIVAAVAPLMGLLGTVTGMIVTFQAITLFGAGDPKLMAGGISQALVTTVLGLTVAIPTLLLHNLLQSRAELINALLQREGVALVAAQAEHHQAVTLPAGG